MPAINAHKNLWKTYKETNLRHNFASSCPSIFQAGQESFGIFSGNTEGQVLSEGFPSASQEQEHCSGYLSREKINPNIYASQSTWRRATLIQKSVFEGDGTDTRWICSLLALVCYSWQHKEGRGYTHKKSKLLFIWTADLLSFIQQTRLSFAASLLTGRASGWLIGLGHVQRHWPC